MMKSIIPIFPLNLVVFPHSKYPLHIFEKKYKKMINKCLKEKTGFGIVAKIDDEMSNIGSYVLITEVLKKYPGGELDIIIVGQTRFSIIDYKMHRDGYYEAEIGKYDDITNNTDSSLLEEVKEKFNKVVNIANYKLDNGFWENFIKTSKKSFKLAEKSGMKLHEQQELLILRSENERLIYLIDHFEKLSKMISENSILRTIVLSNGYLN